MRSLLLGTVACATTFAAIAVIPCHAQPTSILVEREGLSDAPNYGSAYLRALPAYPAAAQQRRLAGSVEVEGRVTESGQLTERHVIAGGEAGNGFSEALAKAIDEARLTPPHDENCLPLAHRMRLRAVFDFDGDEPVVRVTRTDLPPPPLLRQSWAGYSSLKPSVRGTPVYPRSRVREGASAHVYAALEVTPSGRVKTVTTAVHTRSTQPADFEKAAAAALYRWKWEPFALRPGDETMRVCVPVAFEIVR